MADGSSTFSLSLSPITRSMIREQIEMEVRDSGMEVDDDEEGEGEGDGE